MKKYTVAINMLSARQGGGQVYISNILSFVKNYPDIRTYVLQDRNLPSFITSLQLMCSAIKNRRKMS